MARTETGEIDTIMSCVSSDDGIVTATFIDSVITVRGIALGSTTVTIGPLHSHEVSSDALTDLIDSMRV